MCTCERACVCCRSPRYGQLGIASNLHLAWLDTRLHLGDPTALRFPACLELAHTCAVMVDAPKTGVVAEVWCTILDPHVSFFFLLRRCPNRRCFPRTPARQIPEELKSVQYPHYMKGASDCAKGYYHSRSVLGELYDDAQASVLCYLITSSCSKVVWTTW